MSDLVKREIGQTLTDFEKEIICSQLLLGKSVREINLALSEAGFSTVTSTTIGRIRNNPDVKRALEDRREEIVKDGIASLDIRVQKLVVHAENLWKRMYPDNDDVIIPMDAITLMNLTKTYITVLQEIGKLVDVTDKEKESTPPPNQNSPENLVNQTAHMVMRALENIKPNVVEEIRRTLDGDTIEGTFTGGNAEVSEGISETNEYVEERDRTVTIG